MDQTKVSRELKQYIQRVKKKVDPEKIILFGSFAKKRASAWSDIDILVVARFSNIAEKKRFDVLYDLEKDLIRQHDFHVYGVTPQEFENAKPWTIFDEIKKEGIVLYSKN